MPKLHLATEANGYTGWGGWATWVAWYAARQGWTVTIDGADPGLWPIALKLADPWLTIDREPHHVDLCLTTAGNHQVQRVPSYITADRWAVATFVEDTLIRQREVDTYNAADVVLAGSQWNAALLRQNGVTNAVTCVQGVDTAAWHPGVQKRSVFGDRRVIFSGGKLEYRKSQDLVLAAFREYLKEQPDALLVTAWQNAWPQSIKGIDTMGHVKGWPRVTEDPKTKVPRLEIVEWAGRNGIPARNIRDVGILPNWALPAVVAECDLAVFPSRCEGGTNLPAMECLALGLPTYVSAGTGQAELIDWGAWGFFADADVGLGLWEYGPAKAAGVYQGVEGWTETSLATIRAAMSLPPEPSLFPSAVPSWEEAASFILQTAAGQ